MSLAGDDGGTTSTLGTVAICTMGTRSVSGSKGSLASEALTAMGPTELTISVCPSGAARTTNSVPILPPAPGLFSTTKGWPNCLAKVLETLRVRVSVVPPAVNATMTLTGLSG
ncbi:hypothetical protein D3C73_1140550 [compost metagenome]